MADRGDSTPNTFNARSDNAALKLRQSLIQQGRQVAPNAPVVVGPDGRPPAPLPPEGSYIRQAIEAQRQQAQPVEQQRAEAQPPVEPPPPPPDAREQPISDNAARRIRELVAEVREREQENQQLLSLAQQQGATMQQLQQRFEQLQQQHEQLLRESLDDLDPETRIRVMQDARIKEAIGGLEERILSQLMPRFQSIEERAAHAEYGALADTYPAFDPEVHTKLIETFRRRNPHCTIEQAFRAVAEPHELHSRAAASAQAVPPIVPPGNMGARQRYQPEPTPQSNPEQELVEEAQRLRKLRASADPGERKAGMNLLHDHLKRRLFGS